MNQRLLEQILGGRYRNQRQAPEQGPPRASNANWNFQTNPDKGIDNNYVMQMMQAKSEAKDRQIEALTATTNGLQAQIRKLMGAMNVPTGTDIFSVDA